MKLRENDVIVDASVLPAPSDADNQIELLCVTAAGFGKRVAASEFRVQQRGGLGMIATKFKPAHALPLGGDDDSLACLRFVKEANDVMLITSSGTIVRQRAKKIPTQRRTSTGVKVQAVDKGSRITETTIVPDSLLGEEGFGGRDEDGEDGEEEDGEDGEEAGGEQGES